MWSQDVWTQWGNFLHFCGWKHEDIFFFFQQNLDANLFKRTLPTCTHKNVHAHKVQSPVFSITDTPDLSPVVLSVLWDWSEVCKQEMSWHFSVMKNTVSSRIRWDWHFLLWPKNVHMFLHQSAVWLFWHQFFGQVINLSLSLSLCCAAPLTSVIYWNRGGGTQWC